MLLKISDNCTEITRFGKWPTWCTILFYVFIYILNSLHVSSTLCSSSGEKNCVNRTFGSCHSVLVAVSCASPDLNMTQPPPEWQLPEVILTQFVSPDDEHDVLETCIELKIKTNTQKRIVHHIGHLPRICVQVCVSVVCCTRRAVPELHSPVYIFHEQRDLELGSSQECFSIPPPPSGPFWNGIEVVNCTCLLQSYKCWLVFVVLILAQWICPIY